MNKISFCPPDALRLPKNIRAAFFDLDGTLLDSMGVWAQIDIDFLAKRGLTPPPDYMEAITPLGFRATAEYTIARFQLNERPEALMREWQEMAMDAYAHHVPLKKEAPALLDRLKEEGLHLGITSAAAREQALPCLERLGILSYFDRLIFADTSLPGKNEPEIWLHSARELDVRAEDCAAFDDAAVALSAAKQAGMFAVGVYDRHSGSWDAVCAAADLVTRLD